MDIDSPRNFFQNGTRIIYAWRLSNKFQTMKDSYCHEFCFTWGKSITKNFLIRNGFSRKKGFFLLHTGCFRKNVTKNKTKVIKVISVVKISSHRIFYRVLSQSHKMQYNNLVLLSDGYMGHINYIRHFFSSRE